jgi:hypothetical protein
VTSGPEGPAGPGRSDEPEPSEETLRRLEERLDRASEVAERLIVEAAARMARDPEAGQPSGDEPGPEAERSQPEPERSPPRPEPGAETHAAPPPPAGWQRRQDDAAGSSGRGELDLLLQILSAVRDRIPPELQHRLAEALREVLLAIRALIDWYLERTERRRSEAVAVEDIPIV